MFLAREGATGTGHTGLVSNWIFVSWETEQGGGVVCCALKSGELSPDLALSE